MITLRSGFLNQPTSRMLTRVKAVYLYIRENGTVTTTELADEFGTTDRTIQRDLHVLVYNGLVNSPTRGRWKITNKKVKIS
ncbi:DeoR family transcriptional regulator [Lentibacillus sp. Marseille-P4043]|uniref:DeoR family transcriptional regulator n=1 Tax=Lentibacillus sp. Marseille-P4043 TaxID=2040293 RepID=UPI003FA37450